MAFQRGVDGADPTRRDRAARVEGSYEEHRHGRAWWLGTGTLACPTCDAPIALTSQPLGPTDRLDCPYCSHSAPLRDFLSLSQPTRPTRVSLRVVDRDR